MELLPRGARRRQVCASIAGDTFLRGSARRVEVDVEREDAAVLKVVISLAIEE
jgi:hypothetical protein